MSFQRSLICFWVLIISFGATAQNTRFSLASNAAIMHSFKEGQRFWVIGQTVCGQFHFSPTDGAYIWFGYFSPGKFTNQAEAIAKSPATMPQSVTYENKASLDMKHFSIGWKKYLKGRFNEEKKWNLYGLAGFGLMLGAVENIQAPALDTSAYILPIAGGKGNFKRLSFDLTLGLEQPVGGDIFLYSEARVMIPTTDYPSKYLLVNDNAPFTASFNIGLRILF